MVRSTAEFASPLRSDSRNASEASFLPRKARRSSVEGPRPRMATGASITPVSTAAAARFEGEAARLRGLLWRTFQAICVTGAAGAGGGAALRQVLGRLPSRPAFSASSATSTEARNSACIAASWRAISSGIEAGRKRVPAFSRRRGKERDEKWAQRRSLYDVLIRWRVRAMSVTLHVTEFAVSTAFGGIADFPMRRETQSASGNRRSRRPRRPCCDVQPPAMARSTMCLTIARSVRSPVTARLRPGSVR